MKKNGRREISLPPDDAANGGDYGHDYLVAF